MKEKKEANKEEKQLMHICIDDSLSGAERQAQLEYQTIDYALTKFEGNRTAMWKWLGISLKTLQNRLDRYPDLLEKNKILRKQREQKNRQRLL